MRDMDIKDDDMLFQANLLHHSSQESLTGTAQALEKPTDNTSQNTALTSAMNALVALPSSQSQVEHERNVEALPSSLCISLDTAAPMLPEILPAQSRTEGRHGEMIVPEIANFPHSMNGDKAETLKHVVVSKVESMIEPMVDVLLERKGTLSASLKTRVSSNRSNTPTERMREIRFPGRNPREAWKFTVLLRILEIIHGALVTNSVITKREIYYRDPALFLNQNIVDQYVDDLALTFGVSRFSLNVTASARGLVVGALMLHKSDGLEIQSFLERQGHLVPNLNRVERLDIWTIRWVLVVEKEAVFRSLAVSSFWTALSHHGIMITAKGYPDISSRSFIRALSTPSSLNSYCSLPIYALVDFDPDGIDILSTYKHGSKALAHESAALSVPSIQWLGLRSSNMITGNDDGSEGTEDENVHSRQGLLRLSGRDRRKAIKMLERETCAEEGSEPEWRRELQVMLTLNVKAEIEILEARKGGLAGWLKERLA